MPTWVPMTGDSGTISCSTMFTRLSWIMGTNASARSRHAVSIKTAFTGSPSGSQPSITSTMRRMARLV